MDAHVERYEPGHADSGGRIIVLFETDEEMRSVLARLAGWQPISTAPKVHGQMILSTDRYGAVDVIMWNDRAVFHEDPTKPPTERFSWSGAWDDGERGDDVDDGVFVPYEPKWWMSILPLPETSNG